MDVIVVGEAQRQYERHAYKHAKRLQRAKGRQRSGRRAVTCNVEDTQLNFRITESSSEMTQSSSTEPVGYVMGIDIHQCNAAAVDRTSCAMTV